MIPRAGPDRRLAPRPLPLHLASAATLWLGSKAALRFSKSASLPLSGSSGQLRALAAEIAAFGTERVAAALDRELARRAAAWLDGVEAYRRHPFRRSGETAPVLWRQGTTRLLDYRAAGAGGPAVLVVPSLINRYTVLDLLPERSFLSHLAHKGLRPLVVDWDEPGAHESRFDLTAYIARLDTALRAAVAAAGKPIGLVGYCMGGLLALAAALRRRGEVGCLALLATPWDFHAEPADRARLLALTAALSRAVWAADAVPVDLVQSLFFWLDPLAAERKYRRFATFDPESPAAREFVALEDWVNDGVPLASAVAHECLHSWYGANEPALGRWRVGGETVRPERLRRPALVVVPGHDRIVPPHSAEPLAGALAEAEVLRPPLGHVGMMAAATAPDLLWTPLARWLRANLERA